MKQKSYPVPFSGALVVVMAALLFATFFINANPSFAAAAKKKPAAIARASAVDHTEAQIKQLQNALKITKDQEALWINLTQVMRENAKNMDAFTKEQAENFKTMNSVEHMKLHSQITETRLEQLKKFLPPFEALYSSMSDEQKKSTDKIFQTGVYGKAKRK
jgi:predicted phage tail protein